MKDDLLTMNTQPSFNERDELVLKLMDLANTKYIFRENSGLEEKLRQHLPRLLEGSTLSQSGDSCYQGILRNIYREEFLFAEEGLACLSQMTEISVDRKKISFLCELTICANYMLSYTTDDHIELIRLIEELIKQISRQIGISQQSLIEGYPRFTNHIKFLALQILADDFSTAILGEDFYDYIKKTYPISATVSENIQAFVAETCKVNLSQDDVSYLALHIERVSTLL